MTAYITLAFGALCADYVNSCCRHGSHYFMLLGTSQEVVSVNIFGHTMFNT